MIGVGLAALVVLARPARADWLVKVDDPQAAAVMRQSGFTLVHRYRHFPWAVYRATTAAEAQFRLAIAAKSLVAEPDRPVRLKQMPNDAESGTEWIIHPATPDADIHLAEAWDVRTTASAVVVAVIDTGIELDHPDLVPDLWTNAAESTGTLGVDDDGNGYIDDIHGWNTVDNDSTITDTDSHGTNVCGLIGARGDNGIGVAGVCWDVKIMSVRAFSGTTTELQKVLDAFDYILGFPAVRVINCSWSLPDYSPALYDAIAAAQAQAMVVVCAAGNDRLNIDTTPTFPASYMLDNVVSVAAITQTGDFATTFSNYGMHVTLAAPGDALHTTTLGQAYIDVSGTSFAAPIVSGAVALLLAQEPTLGMAAVHQRLQTSSTATPKLAGVPLGAGLLNVRDLLLHTPNAVQRWSGYR